MSPLVAGLGNPDRGDDGVGTAVVAALPTSIDAVEVRDPVGLLELFAGRDLVLVVDAARYDAPAGTVRRLETGASLPPLSVESHSTPSSHALDLGAVIELARALGLLPFRVIVLAVAGENFAPGSPLSAAAARAVAAVVPMVLETIGCAAAERRPSP